MADAGRQAGRTDCGEIIQKEGPGLHPRLWGRGWGDSITYSKQRNLTIHLAQGAHDAATLDRQDLLGGGAWAPSAAIPSLGVFHSHCEDPPVLPFQSLTLRRMIATFFRRQGM